MDYPLAPDSAKVCDEWGDCLRRVAGLIRDAGITEYEGPAPMLGDSPPVRIRLSERHVADTELPPPPGLPDPEEVAKEAEALLYASAAHR